MYLYETKEQFDKLIERCPYVETINFQGNQYVQVFSNEPLETELLTKYVEYGHKKFGKYLTSMELQFDGDFVDIHYGTNPLPGFERTRRITGYLVGTLDRFNDAKLAEVKDRVKHEVK